TSTGGAGTGGAGTGGVGTGGVGTGGVGTGGVGTGGVGTGGVGTGGVGTGGVGTGGAGTGGAAGCQDPTDCGNPISMICDPATKTCAAGQCSSAAACPSGKTCLTQTETATVGACYPSCTPYGTPCLSGATCVLAAFD